MKPSLHLKLNQQLAMTPQLQQAIRLLQLSSVELELKIRAELAGNPLLESIEDTTYGTRLARSLEPDIEVIAETPWDMDYWQTLPHATQARHKEEPALQNINEDTLQQHLLWQMEMSSFSKKEKAIATALIDAISEEGYLTCSLLEIQQGVGITTFCVSDIESVLLRIQQFDPLGVGARDLAECLSLQLNALPEGTPYLTEAKNIAKTHLQALGKRDYARIKGELNLNDKALKGATKILTALDPRPGIKHSPIQKSDYLIPDVMVGKKNGRWIVELNKEFIPNLRVNPNYLAVLQGADKRNSGMLQEQLKEANWFLKSLKTRHETLLNVATAIIEQQKAFLEEGELAMKPLNLGDIAHSLGLHESTISRITTQKYIFTPRGVFELKYFFSGKISKENALSLHTQHSATAIRAFIKKLIATETIEEPFSDGHITKRLSEQGIRIARRTVAKYREALGIQSSARRKTSRFKN